MSGDAGGDAYLPDEHGLFLSRGSAQIKSTVKRKLYEDSRVPLAVDSLKKSAKKAAAPASTPHVVVAAGMQSAASLAPPIKKQKTAGTPPVRQNARRPMFIWTPVAEQMLCELIWTTRLEKVTE